MHFRLRDQIFDPRWCHENPGIRPWSWWQFESPEPRRPDRPEPAQLESLDLLEPWEHEALAAEAHDPVGLWDPPFRRSWPWWRYGTKCGRDWEYGEACQLVIHLPDRLTDRERSIYYDHRDAQHEFQWPHLDVSDCGHLDYLTPNERSALKLPALRPDVDDEGPSYEDLHPERFSS